ncbi:MAG: hypothetical protein JF599_06270 [Verrucomicrobia bacterium]|nr:hypothetical protein [Verrucomicrobiota bacterium]
MKAKLCFLTPAATGLFTVLLLAGIVADVRAEGRKNPTSKLYVADVEGDSSINTGEKIDDLVKKSVYSAEGTVIETKAKASNALVLSNGTGLFFDPETKLEMKRFQQEPFSPNRNDMEVEPSVSQTAATLPHGTIGLCTSKMVAGSTMNFSTPHANIAIHARKAVIESTANETRISIFDGNVTIGGSGAGGESVQSGQQAIITRPSPTSPPIIKIQPIPPEQKQQLADKAAMACMARKTVYFQVADRKNSSALPGDVFSDPTDVPQDIVPVEVVPSTIEPVITVSPSAITP